MDNKLHIYQLHFTTPLHISNERGDYTKGNAMIHSDTFYAAIFSAWALLGKKEWIPINENESLGFAISSLFPFLKRDEKVTYFFPRPFYRSKNSENQDGIETVIKKKIKKASWVDSGLFRRILSNHRSGTLTLENFSGPFWSERSLMYKNEKGSNGKHYIVKSSVVPRVTVPRELGKDTSIFYIERFYFEKDAGLHFYIQFDNETIKKRVEAALNLLAEEGIGTDRNIGNGKFKWEYEGIMTFEHMGENGLCISLGLLCPENNDSSTALLKNKHVGYELIKRGGWLGEPHNTWRKRNVYMYREGSCFSKIGENPIQILGKIVDLKPLQSDFPHPVWRCGRTLLLNF